MTIKSRHVIQVPLAEIEVPDGRRSLDKAKVEALIDSFKQIGQRTPIECWRPKPGSSLRLISGLHRLEACKRLNIPTIAAMIFEGEEIDAKIAAIDENLCRTNMSTVEETLAIEARTALIEAKARKAGKNIHLDEPVSGVPIGTPLLDTERQRSRAEGKPTGEEPASTRDVAKKTGKSKTTVHRARTRVKLLGQPTLQDIVRTDLDKPGELDALIELPQEERRQLVEMAKAGKKVSARAIVQRKRAKSRLQAAWDDASDADRIALVRDLKRSGKLDELLSSPASARISEEAKTELMTPHEDDIVRASTNDASDGTEHQQPTEKTEVASEAATKCDDVELGETNGGTAQAVGSADEDCRGLY